jgi:DNA-binding MarR family transcriptional regulator
VARSHPETEVARLRVALSRIARQIDRQVSNGGMPRTQLSVLGTVAVRKKLGMGELADVEGINPTMLSRVVGRLEADGLVLRAPSAEDRRVIQVGITPAGTKLHNRLRQERTSLLAAHLDGLPDGQATALIELLPALESLAAALRADAPRADAPRADAPRADAPRADAPPAGAPRTGAARTGAPRTGAARTGAARPDAPQPGAARPDAPQPGTQSAGLATTGARR